MSGGARWKEPVKTALIVLLTASALFLMDRCEVFRFLLPERASVSVSQPEEDAISYSPAALPLSAAVTGPSGLCYGLKYDSAALRELYQSVSAYLGEAVGSAEMPQEMSEEQWLHLLDGESLVLDYQTPVPLCALAAWLGVENPLQEALCTLILSEGENETVRFSFRDASGAACSCETAGAWGSLRSWLETYLPNGAFFTRRWDSLADCDPGMLVLEKLPPLFSVSAATVQDAPSEKLAEKAGIHLNSQSRYTESDGTVVYPGESGVLRLLPDGSFSFSVSERFSLGEADSLPALLERSRSLLEELHLSCAGDELLRCTACRIDAALSGTVEFSYVCEGLPVLTAAGSAARVRWENGRLTELTFLPRCYRILSEQVELLPEKQAAAAAGSKKTGGEAGLVLYDGGEDRLTPFWQVK